MANLPDIYVRLLAPDIHFEFDFASSHMNLGCWILLCKNMQHGLIFFQHNSTKGVEAVLAGNFSSSRNR
jgi:hypothetical protein